MIRDDVCEVDRRLRGDGRLCPERRPQPAPMSASATAGRTTLASSLHRRLDSSQPAANGPKREQGIGRLVLGTPDRIERVTVTAQQQQRRRHRDLALDDKPVIFVTAPLEPGRLSAGLPRPPAAPPMRWSLVNDTGAVFCHDVTAGHRTS